MPDTIGNLKNLAELHSQYNHLLSLPSSVRTLPLVSIVTNICLDPSLPYFINPSLPRYRTLSLVSGSIAARFLTDVLYADMQALRTDDLERYVQPASSQLFHRRQTMFLIFALIV